MSHLMSHKNSFFLNQKEMKEKRKVQGCRPESRFACCVALLLKIKYTFSSSYYGGLSEILFCVFSRLVSKAAVVKGLNTLSAWALQNGLLAGKQVREVNK